MGIQTAVLKIRRGRAGADVLDRISVILKNGGLVAYPTETFYGLGVIAYDVEAVGKIYNLKSRSEAKPLSVIVADMAMAEKIADSVPPLFFELGREFWPGPLTLVVRAKPVFPPLMLGPGRSIAMRVPGLAWLRELVRRVEAPLTATSANISGDREISDPGEILEIFNGKVDLIIDGGATPGGWASTIVDLTRTAPRILRPGAVPASRLKKYFQSTGTRA
jgi:L-threonylcarbamoyladenylate synthase